MNRAFSIGTLVFVSLLASCLQESESDPELWHRQNPVIYGEDDRQDYYAHPDPALRELTRRSVVSLMERADLDLSNPNQIIIDSGILADRGLCPEERFLNHPDASDCSGTLIDDDLVLTAGHCVSNHYECRSYYFVFNYFYEAEGQLATITSDDVYECQRLVVQHLDRQRDYAIIQLDRRVAPPHGPAPVKIGDFFMEEEEPITVIGFCNGIPAKIDSGGHVIDGRRGVRDYFIATPDAFGGSSGSGTFNAMGELVGILVRGENDYTISPEGCFVPLVFPENGEDGGEDITYVSAALEDLCDSPIWNNNHLCGQELEGWCNLCGPQVPCPSGWSCEHYEANPEATYCAPPCTVQEDCIEGHTCDDRLCRPEAYPNCSQDNVWLIDSCRNRIRLEEICDGPCMDGECLPEPSGNVCERATPIEAIPQTLSGSLAFYQNLYEGHCGGTGPEQVYTFTTTEESRFTAMAFGFDTVLYLRHECDDTEISCNDDSDPPGNYGSRISPVIPPGTYYLFVDSYSDTVGPYELRIDFDEDVEIFLGDSCEFPQVIQAVDQHLTGTMLNSNNNDSGSCGGAGPERVFEFTLTEPLRLTADSTGFDTILYLRRDCADFRTEQVCNDDATPPGMSGSHLAINLDPGTYFLFLDAYHAENNPTAYQLNLSFGHDCSAECTPGELTCQEGQVVECIQISEHCFNTTPLYSCEEFENCQRGGCIFVCHPDARICTEDRSGYYRCSKQNGLWGWNDLRGCPEDFTCGIFGLCSPKPEEKPVTQPTNKPGCDCKIGGSVNPTVPPMLMLISMLLFFRRRPVPKQ